MSISISWFFRGRFRDLMAPLTPPPTPPPPPPHPPLQPVIDQLKPVSLCRSANEFTCTRNAYRLFSGFLLFLQVSMHYNRDVRARYVVEQPDLPDLLKLMSRRTTCTSGGRRRANGFKTAEEDFWWACGLCFFERRKKSTVKAHVTQRVCQKTSLRKEMRQRRKALGHLKRYASCEFSTEGFEDIEPLAWNSPLSV